MVSGDKMPIGRGRPKPIIVIFSHMSLIFPWHSLETSSWSTNVTLVDQTWKMEFRLRVVSFFPPLRSIKLEVETHFLFEYIRVVIVNILSVQFGIIQFLPVQMSDRIQLGRSAESVANCCIHSTHSGTRHCY